MLLSDYLALVVKGRFVDRLKTMEFNSEHLSESVQKLVYTLVPLKCLHLDTQYV